MLTFCARCPALVERHLASGSAKGCSELQERETSLYAQPYAHVDVSRLDHPRPGLGA